MIPWWGITLILLAIAGVLWWAVCYFDRMGD